MTVLYIAVLQGTTPALSDPLYGFPLAYTGTGSCLMFNGYAQYESGTASVNWSSASPSMVVIDQQGLACMVATPSGSILGSVPLAATATGSGDKTTFAFYLKLSASGSLDVDLH